MSSSSSTGSTAEEEGGGDEAETVLAPSPKRRAWHPPRKELGLSVDTHGWQAETSAEALAGVNAVGKRIEGIFLCEGASLQWYGGLITRFSESSGEHLVVYDDGERELRVSRDMIRVLGEPESGSGSSASQERTKLMEGTPIEARYRGKAKYYPGKIAAVGSDGTFSIDYDDGEEEMGVKADLIKLRERSGDGASRRGAGARRARLCRASWRAQMRSIGGKNEPNATPETAPCGSCESGMCRVNAPR